MRSLKMLVNDGRFMLYYKTTLDKRKVISVKMPFLLEQKGTNKEGRIKFCHQN